MVVAKEAAVKAAALQVAAATKGAAGPAAVRAVAAMAAAAMVEAVMEAAATAAAVRAAKMVRVLVADRRSWRTHRQSLCLRHSFVPAASAGGSSQIPPQRDTRRR